MQSASKQTHTDRYTDRHTDGHTDGQTDGHTYMTERQTTGTVWKASCFGHVCTCDYRLEG